MAPLPYMIWRPKTASYCAMTAYSRSNSQIDIRYGSATPMKRHITWLAFEIYIFKQFWQPLAALTQLRAATITTINTKTWQKWIQQLEKKTK